MNNVYKLPINGDPYLADLFEKMPFVLLAEYVTEEFRGVDIRVRDSAKAIMLKRCKVICSSANGAYRS